MKTVDALKVLGALSQETRLSIFRLLVPIGEEGLAAGQISDALGVAPATTSFHLKELENAGLVNARRDGRHIFYRLAHTTMRDLLAFLLRDCCQGRPEICAPLGIDCGDPAAGEGSGMAEGSLRRC